MLPKKLPKKEVWYGKINYGVLGVGMILSAVVVYVLPAVLGTDKDILLFLGGCIAILTFYKSNVW